jgi:sterol desaturase/sphingolipid hydroxylase (fatty acid hydroxylase superfamily)
MRLNAAHSIAVHIQSFQKAQWAATPSKSMLMTETALIAAVAVQGAMVALDLWDQRTTRPGDQGERHSLSGPALLIVATLVFLAVQILGDWLIPAGPRFFTAARERWEQWTGAPTDAIELAAAASMVLAVSVFYIAGFWDYWVHRAFSHSRWFWFTHEYHHLPNRVTVFMPGILARPYAFVPAFLSSVAVAATCYPLLIALGVSLKSLEHLLPAFLFIVTVLTASHSSFLRRWPVVHRLLRFVFITTPHEHLLHHAIGGDCNYGNFTTLWDRVFGTYRDPCDPACASVRVGLAYDQDFLGTLTAGRVKIPPIWRSRLHVARYCNVIEPAAETATSARLPRENCENAPSTPVQTTTIA